MLAFEIDPATQRVLFWSVKQSGKQLSNFLGAKV